ncbi:MAG: hypothetical protein J0I24_11800 [Thiomonas arsenitoxydans]|uniref:Uncharacterized protein n=1 Tax=Thiomonas arsenitoxydans (strain DSM 22701 / CIP 110005 / 3As) TaxID=426114 RepID=A0A8I1MYP4_THIA3|nr:MULTISPECIES: hypothetical protein [Thiomonas]MBN8744976.1 hypothetical protein [Thiomonas arsenitoxydans]ODU93148.1 MAG: hypothetical protein ABT24_13410 [Thiomonas sp. SCN 64-16]
MYGLGAPAHCELDMAITRSAFARQLSMAFPTLRADGPQAYSGHDAGCDWHIRLHPAEPTRLGLIVLERWLAEVSLTAADPAKRRAWWQQFTAHFQKGGG